MKSNIVIILALSVILTACSSTKNNLTNTTDKSTAQNESTNTLSNTAIQNTSEKLNDEYATMFAKLEMSKEQISTFTSEMNRFKNKQANTASGEMLGSIESERTRQLEDILSSSQYAKYEQWLAENE
ncbi:hypothetical protein [Maribacter sp.]|uniref:hypothetical protein n=1 Tax=Maribacter sp. TaxID=1897614 RepID=UPI0032994B86